MKKYDLFENCEYKVDVHLVLYIKLNFVLAY